MIDAARLAICLMAKARAASRESANVFSGQAHPVGPMPTLEQQVRRLEGRRGSVGDIQTKMPSPRLTGNQCVEHPPSLRGPATSKRRVKEPPNRRGSRQMRQGEPALALHLVEARGGALEHPGILATLVEL